MGIDLENLDGATPLDADDLAALIPGHLTTRRQLYAWEAANILKAETWAFSRRHENLLSVDFALSLHKQMFDDTWKWAGKIRRKEILPVGVAPERVEMAMKNLCLDVEEQLKNKAWDSDEIAARFHHRLVFIHPFTDGNGRFCRMITDLLLVHQGKDRFTWGGADLNQQGRVRKRYIAALRAADGKDYRALLGVVRGDGQ